MNKYETQITDDLLQLTDILPPALKSRLENNPELPDLLEVVMDLGRIPEARFAKGFVNLGEEFVSRDDLEYVVKRISSFGKDNRSGIERTLHRISALRNRAGKVVGLTCRAGRAVYGTIKIIRDLVDSGKSILFLGKPGVGKTTMLREVARVLADEFEKRVIIVDTSNEIAGDGDIPHPGIGKARRMQVTSPEFQHAVMIEAVENHMPEVIVVDEIGTLDDAYASRTIAERGVQLVATAHGNTLDNLIKNPTLSDLVGGVQAVTLSDEEARNRGTQKTVLERKAPPTFDILVEIKDRETLHIHADVAQTIDLMLRGSAPAPEIRTRNARGEAEIIQPSNLEEVKDSLEKKSLIRREPPFPFYKRLRIFPYGVSRNRLQAAIDALGVNAAIVRKVEEADLLLVLKVQGRRITAQMEEFARTHKQVAMIKSNTNKQIESFLSGFFHQEEAKNQKGEEPNGQKTNRAVFDLRRR